MNINPKLNAITPEQDAILRRIHKYATEKNNLSTAYTAGIFVTQFSYYQRYFKDCKSKCAKRKFKENILMALRSSIDLPCDIYTDLCDMVCDMLEYVEGDYGETDNKSR